MSKASLTVLLAAVLVLCTTVAGTAAFLIGRNQGAAVVPAAAPALSTEDDGDNQGTDKADRSAAQAPASAVGSAGAPGSAQQSAQLSAQQSVPQSAELSGADSSAAGASGPSVPAVDIPTENGESTLVQFADPSIAEQPGAGRVRDLLQQHFNAINSHDYAAWAGTVTSDQPAKIDESRWQQEYSSSVDTEIVIEQLQDSPLQVSFSLRSRQDPEKSFDGASDCTDWRLVWPLIDEGAGWRIGRAAPGSAEPRVCDN